MERRVIINADDFGLSEGVNHGILRAHREGILTSASLMVRAPAAMDAVQRAGRIDLGLHLDLGEWVFRDGEWITLYERAPLEDEKALEREVHYQLQEFQRLTGKTPTHLDSHQHVHLQEPLQSIAWRMAKQLSAPLRGCNADVLYCGSFYGQSGRGEPCPEAISAKALIELLTRLPPGVTELGCHPGEDDQLDSTYVRERFVEVGVLCDPRVRQTLVDENIRLSTFVDVSLVWS
jgi:predicted glycoside hydrolase/deacetylase ChbG (UPF0249 family)